MGGPATVAGPFADTLVTGLSTPCIVIRSYEFRHGLKGDEGADADENEEQYQNRDDHQYEIGPAHNDLTLLYRYSAAPFYPSQP